MFELLTLGFKLAVYPLGGITLLLGLYFFIRDVRDDFKKEP